MKEPFVKPCGFSPEDELYGKLRACGHFLYHKSGGKLGQQRILSILMDHGGISQRELQDILGVQSGSLSEILAKIEADDFIRRDRSDADKRQVVIEITEAGKAEAAHMKEEHTLWVKNLFEGLSGDERENLGELLDKLLVNLKSYRGEEEHMRGRDSVD